MSTGLRKAEARRGAGGRSLAARFAVLALVLSVLALSGCGPGNGSKSGSGTTTLTVAIALPAPSTSGFSPQAPKGTANEVAGVAVELHDGWYGSIPAGQPDRVEYLDWDAENSVWTKTITGIPLGTTTTFVGRAYNKDVKNNPADAIEANEIFNGYTVAALSGNDQLTLALSPIDDGNGILLPMIEGIYLPAEIAVGKTASIDFAVSGQNGETLTFQLNSSDGTFTSGTTPVDGSGTGSIALDGAGKRTINVSYTAPASVGAYTHSITLTNSQGNSIAQSFATNIVYTVTNGDVTVLFAPVVTAISAQRTGTQLFLTATVSDDVTPLDVTYQWGFAGSGLSGIGISGSTATGVLQPYDETATGTIFLTVTDEGGAGLFTSIQFDVPKILDSPVILYTDVALFANTSFVDYDPTFVDSGASASNMEKTLSLLGFSVETFTGYTATAINAATQRRGVLAIPELELGDLNAALDEPARDAIRSFVLNRGGTLLINQSDNVGNPRALLNALFGLSYTLLNGGTPVAPILLNTTDAKGTPFAYGTTQLSVNTPSTSIDPASLPSGARRIFTDAAGNSVVTLIPYGADGWVVILGWSWEDARPVGAQDGGWLKVVSQAVSRKAYQKLSAVDRGAVADTGVMFSPSGNTYIGLSGGNLSNGYFVFDTSTLEGVPVSATLRLETHWYWGVDPSETLSIWDVSTSPDLLSGGGVDMYTDLGTGMNYGGFTVNAGEIGRVYNSPLNPQAITDLKAAGEFFTVGLKVETIGYTSTNEAVRFSPSNTPPQVNELLVGAVIKSVPPLIQVAAGYSHTCLLDSNGVRCKGAQNNYNQLNPPPLTNPRMIGAGSSGLRNCALDDSGVVCWGVGSGGANNVPPLTNPTQIAVGNGHTCALDDTGAVCWGNNSYGQITVPALSNPRQITTNIYHSCALDDTGVKCWGGNSSGQTNVPALSNPTYVTAGRDHTCAMDDTGVVCWGNSGSGRLNVPALSNPTRIDAGLSSTCALDDTGVVCWGSNTFGKSTPPATFFPSQISVDSNHACAVDDTGLVCWGDSANWNNAPFTQIAAGFYYTCGLGPSGVECWGYNASGQTDVPILYSPTQVVGGSTHTCALDLIGIKCWGASGYGALDVPSLSSPTQVTAGGGHTCALDDTGVVCWGRNDFGQTTVPTLTNPTLVTAGGLHTCALDDTGVVCWGRPNEGQTTPPSLTAPSYVSAAKVNHTCALDDTGVKCWGYDAFGQSTVPALSTPFAVEAGGYHSCALDSSGAVCWGNGTNGEKNIPALSSPTNLAVGRHHNCVLDSTGAVCWGRSSEGQTTVPPRGFQ